MGKSIKVHLKRRGRPATGKDPLVSARLPQSMINRIEDWGGRNDATRSEAIRRLLELGLEAPAKKSKEEPPGTALIPLRHRRS
jgi:Arc/MetJ-type ribon-helix-helix transcriptional regulator